MSYEKEYLIECVIGFFVSVLFLVHFVIQSYQHRLQSFHDIFERILFVQRIILACTSFLMLLFTFYYYTPLLFSNLVSMLIVVFMYMYVCLNLFYFITIIFVSLSGTRFEKGSWYSKTETIPLTVRVLFLLNFLALFLVCFVQLALQIWDPVTDLTFVLFPFSVALFSFLQFVNSLYFYGKFHFTFSSLQHTFLQKTEHDKNPKNISGGPSLPVVFPSVPIHSTSPPDGKTKVTTVICDNNDKNVANHVSVEKCLDESLKGILLHFCLSFCRSRFFSFFFGPEIRIAIPPQLQHTRATSTEITKTPLEYKSQSLLTRLTSTVSSSVSQFSTMGSHHQQTSPPSFLSSTKLMSICCPSPSIQKVFFSFFVLLVFFFLFLLLSRFFLFCIDKDKERYLHTTK